MSPTSSPPRRNVNCALVLVLVTLVVLLDFSEANGMDYWIPFPGSNDSLGMNCSRIPDSLNCACQQARSLSRLTGYTANFHNRHRILEPLAIITDHIDFYNIVNAACCNSRNCNIEDLLNICIYVKGTRRCNL